MAAFLLAAQAVLLLPASHDDCIEMHMRGLVPETALTASDGMAEGSCPVESHEYSFAAVEPGTYAAHNRPRALRSRIDGEGIEVTVRDTSIFGVASDSTLSLRTRAFGRVGQLCEVGAPALSAHENRIELRHEGFTEFYVNDERGIEQGWTLHAPPSGPDGSPVRIEIEVTGPQATIRADASSALFVDADSQTRFRYEGLRAWDATGRDLAARLVGSTGGIAVEVDAGGALYPLTIDPVLTSPAWTAEGDQANAHFGADLAGAGDVNGDGYDDVIVGAPDYDNGEVGEGRAYLYLGSSSGLSATPAWTVESDHANGWMGRGVSGAGDVDGDGFDDVIVGASAFTNGEAFEGRAYVYLGSASGLAATAAWTAESDQADAHFGNGVSGAGDVNGDGFDDVIVGASNFDNGESNEGRAFLYLGSPTGLSATPAWTAESDQASAHFGTILEGAGDVNGDGFDDVLVSAHFYTNGQLNEGRAYLYLGSPSGLSATPAWIKEGNQVEALFGRSVSGAGDVDGDGFDDVIVGAMTFDNGQNNEGRAYLYMGSSSGLSAVPDWTAEGNQAGAFFGIGVSVVGDVDGDGFDDVLVGASSFDNGPTDEGVVFLYLGSSSGLAATPDSTAESDQVDPKFGLGVSGAGDVDGDGFDDMIVAAQWFDSGQANEGRVFLYRGRVQHVEPYCFGDGSAAACPCSNDGQLAHGCENSAATGGARLAAFGTTQPDTLVLGSSGELTSALSIFLQGDFEIAPSPFGDGLRCAGGSLKRLFVVNAVSGTASAPGPGDPSVTQRSATLGDPIAPGSMRFYQVYYRDPDLGFCPTPQGNSWNVSNGLRVTW